MAIGTWDVDGMLDEMTPQELTGWMAYYHVEPFGEERADMRSGVHGAAIINAWAGKDVVKPKHFDYITPRRTRRQSVRSMRANFEAIAERHRQWQSRAT